MVSKINKVKTTCGDTMWKSLNWAVISSDKNWRFTINTYSVVPPVLFRTNYYSIEILHGVTAIILTNTYTLTQFSAQAGFTLKYIFQFWILVRSLRLSSIFKECCNIVITQSDFFGSKLKGNIIVNYFRSPFSVAVSLHWHNYAHNPARCSAPQIRNRISSPKNQKQVLPWNSWWSPPPLTTVS